MSLVFEAAEAIREEKDIEDGAAATMGMAAEEYSEPSGSGFGFPMPDLSIILAKTGSGSIEEYIDHPLNRSGSRGMAQMIRGITGILGETDFAIVDIALGALEYTKEKGNGTSESK